MVRHEQPPQDTDALCSFDILCPQGNITRAKWLVKFRKNNKTSELELKVLDKTVTACLDTGSTRTLMTEDLAKEICGISYESMLHYKNYRNMRDAQNNELETLGGIYFKIQIGKQIYQHEVIIYKSTHKEFLLGNDFTSDNKLGIFPSLGIVAYETDQQKARHVIGQTDHIKLPCISLENFQLSPGQEKRIKLRLDTDLEEADKLGLWYKDFIVHSEDMETVTGLNELSVYYSMITLDKQLEFLVYIKNTEFHTKNYEKTK